MQLARSPLQRWLCVGVSAKVRVGTKVVKTTGVSRLTKQIAFVSGQVRALPPAGGTIMPALNHQWLSKHPPQKAQDGIWAIQRIHLPTGQRLYRFGSTAAPELWFAGAWWMQFEEFKKIQRSAEEAGISLGYAARRFLAIKHEWGNANVVVSAVVAEPLDAYAGRGRVQLADQGAVGGAYDWHPPADFMQLYIPGLVDGTRRRSSLSKRAFTLEQHEFIRSEAFR